MLAACLEGDRQDKASCVLGFYMSCLTSSAMASKAVDSVCDRSATAFHELLVVSLRSEGGSLSLKQPTQSQHAQRAVRKREKRTPQRSARRTLNYPRATCLRSAISRPNRKPFLKRPRPNSPYAPPVSAHSSAVGSVSFCHRCRDGRACRERLDQQRIQS